MNKKQFYTLVIDIINFLEVANALGHSNNCIRNDILTIGNIPTGNDMYDIKSKVVSNEFNNLTTKYVDE